MWPMYSMDVCYDNCCIVFWKKHFDSMEWHCVIDQDTALASYRKEALLEGQTGNITRTQVPILLLCESCSSSFFF